MDLTVCYTNSIWVRRTNNRTVGPPDNEHSLSRDTYISERGGVRVQNALTCFACVFIIPHQVETSSTRLSHAALAVEFSIADQCFSNFQVNIPSEQVTQNYFIYISTLELNYPKTRASVFDLLVI